MVDLAGKILLGLPRETYTQLEHENTENAFEKAEERHHMSFPELTHLMQNIQQNYNIIQCTVLLKNIKDALL